MGLGALRQLPAVSVPPGVVSPYAIASDEAFGTPHLSRKVSPAGIITGEAFGAAAASSTTAYGRIASAEAFGTPTLSPGPVSISPAGIASGEAFGTALVTRTINVAGQGIASGQAFGTPALTPGSVTVSLAAIASGEAFGTGKLSRFLLLEGIASEEAVGSPRAVKQDLAEQRRVERVAAGLEWEDVPKRRFVRIPILDYVAGGQLLLAGDLYPAPDLYPGVAADVPVVVGPDGSFVYGPLGRTIDFDAEVREEAIQTADGSVAEGLEEIGVFDEVAVPEEA